MSNLAGDVQSMRTFMANRGYDQDQITDKQLEHVILGARYWVGRLRYSWKIVAYNYLKDGYYHA